MIKNILKMKNKGFTLAEVLVTLSIIGIIAAILFPSILANYTERTLNAKRQALFARMSQAMAELADAFPNYEDPTNIEQNSALKFINEGLSKTYKISAACDYATLASCDIPQTITKLDGTTFNLISNTQDFFTYSPFSKYTLPAGTPSYQDASWYTWANNTVPAGLMTKNGESILLFFNPKCKTQTKGNYITSASNYITTACVNMIYDLNGGKQKPNRINEDIGFLTVFYSDAPYVVSPKITTNTSYVATANTGATNQAYGANLVSYAEAKAACAAMGDNVRLPSYEEMGSIAINSAIYMDNDSYVSSGTTSLYYWTSKAYSTNSNVVVQINPNDTAASGESTSDTTLDTVKHRYLCVQD